MSIIFPVIDTEIPMGVYHPLPYYPEDAWQNKNRHPWSYDEVKENMIEILGSDGIEPARYGIIGIAFDPKNKRFSEHSGVKKFIKDVDPTLLHHWNLFKIIKMGSQAFSSDRFPTGASATIGDYVNVDPTGVKMFRFKKLVVASFVDQSVTLVVKDPLETINL